MSAIRDIAAILEYGSKSSTYKYALLRSIVEFTMERPDDRPLFGWHLIPAIWLARRFISYYWLLTEQGVPQAPQNVAVRTHIDRYCKEAGALLVPKNVSTLTDFEACLDDIAPIPDSAIELLYAVRSEVLKSPVTHVQNLRSERVDLFSMLMRTRVPGKPDLYTLATDYESGLRSLQRSPAEERRLRHDVPTWDNLESNEFAYLAISDRVFVELAEARTILRETISLRWLERSASYADGVIPLAEWTRSFLELDTARDPTAIKGYRNLYESLGIRTCLYTGQECQPGFPLDHVLPFRYFPVNAFWNLVPIASTQLNGSKSAHLPLLEGPTLQRLRQHVANVASANHPLVERDIVRIMGRERGTLANDQVADAVLRHVDGMYHRLQESVPGRLWSA